MHPAFNMVTCDKFGVASIKDKIWERQLRSFYHVEIQPMWTKWNKSLAIEHEKY